MNRMLSGALLALAFAPPAEAQQKHGRYDFPFVVDGQELVLTYEGGHDLMRPDPAVKLVVFVHHGGSQNPVTYYKGMSVQETADYALKTELVALGGSGGAIALDRGGNFATPYTDDGMYRCVREDGVIEVRIYDR